MKIFCSTSLAIIFAFSSNFVFADEQNASIQSTSSTTIISGTNNHSNTRIDQINIQGNWNNWGKASGFSSNASVQAVEALNIIQGDNNQLFSQISQYTQQQHIQK